MNWEWLIFSNRKAGYGFKLIVLYCQLLRHKHYLKYWSLFDLGLPTLDKSDIESVTIELMDLSQISEIPVVTNKSQKLFILFSKSWEPVLCLCWNYTVVFLITNTEVPFLKIPIIFEDGAIKHFISCYFKTFWSNNHYQHMWFHDINYIKSIFVLVFLKSVSSQHNWIASNSTIGEMDMKRGSMLFKNVVNQSKSSRSLYCSVH